MMKAVHRSDIGRVRAVNEDRAYSAKLANGYTLAVVADGMGGHQAGDIASRLAVETVVHELSVLPDEMVRSDRRLAVKQAILRANDTIFQLASQDEKYNQMGTTIVVALLADQEAVIGHIGDSRAYIANESGLHQVTEDHSLVYELLKSGQITAEEAARHPRRNVLTRALGTDKAVEVDMNEIAMEQGDVMLLCTDGLTNMISPHAIWSIITDPSQSIDTIADRLVSEAIDAGGDDNISVILVQMPDSNTEKKGWNS